MVRVAILQSAHETTIEDNPIEVLIRREERVRDEGGFDQAATFVGLVRGRLYQEAAGSSGRAALEVTTPGIQLRN